MLGPASKSSIAAACIVWTQKYVPFSSWHQTFYFLCVFIEYWTPPLILHRWDFQDKFNHLEMRHTSKLSFVSNKEKTGWSWPHFGSYASQYIEQNNHWVERIWKTLLSWICNIYVQMFIILFSRWSIKKRKNWHHSIKRNWHLSIFGQTTCLEIIGMHTCGDKKIKWRQQQKQVTTQQTRYLECVLYSIFTYCHICLVLQSSINHIDGWNCPKFMHNSKYT